MCNPLPASISVWARHKVSHLQGIAIDEKREFLYCSFTTRLIKTDLQGNILGSVTGLAGHLGCIAYNAQDGKIYGSLEFKKDSIGKGILERLGISGELEDSFYIVRFDTDRIDRMEIDAQQDDIMQAVFLEEVYNDYSAEGHRLGCSGIDGVTFAPAMGEDGEAEYLYVAYGVYGDTARTDNDHQVILKYDISQWDRYAQPLNQRSMHRCGPEKPDAKYFVYTGNTNFGIQNLEYDPDTRTMLAAVYPGSKPQFPNYPMFFIDCAKTPEQKILTGIGETGLTLPLTDLDSGAGEEICGSAFPYGNTGMISLGGGYFYMAESIHDETGFSGVVKLYKLDRRTLAFTPQQQKSRFQKGQYHETV